MKNFFDKEFVRFLTRAEKFDPFDILHPFADKHKPLFTRRPDFSMRRLRFEALEPRILLSADLNPVPNPLEPTPADQAVYQLLPADQPPVVDMALADPALPPFGSLIHTAPVAASFDAVNETDTFSVNVDRGQTLTIGIQPQDTSILTSLTVTNPSGIPTTVIAGAAGEPVIIQNLQTGDGGTFIITATNQEGTGAYNAAYWLNTQVETETYGGATNNDIASAVDLSGSAVSLDGGGDRLAVVGQSDGVDADFYAFTLNADQAATIGLTPTQQDIPEGALSLELYDSVGNLISLGQDSWSNIDETVRDFVAPAAGTYYAKVSGTAGLEYTLLVVRGADFNLEPNDQPAQAQGLTNGDVLGSLGLKSNGASGGVIDVAVVSSGSGSYADTGLQAIVNQLNDNTASMFNATLVTPAQVDTLDEIAAFDAVVIGGTLYSSGFNSFAATLLPYVQGGGD